METNYCCFSYAKLEGLYANYVVPRTLYFLGNCRKLAGAKCVVPVFITNVSKTLINPIARVVFVYTRDAYLGKKHFDIR